jgi:hypothetical protein
MGAVRVDHAARIAAADPRAAYTACLVEVPHCAFASRAPAMVHDGKENRVNRRNLLLCVAALGLGLLSLAPVGPAAAQEESRYFPETRHTVRGLFLKYWTEHGGLAQQGYPLTDEFQEQSKLNGQVYTVQYFERAIFEHHPENQPPYDVLLSQLGTYELDARYPNGANPAAAPVNGASGADSRYFPETKHIVSGLFLKYWTEHGGLVQQGYPLTEPFQERSALNGQTYTVQYFERAIFEHHPENAGTPYEVLLSQLGKYQLDSRYPNGGTPTATPVATGTPPATTTPLADVATPTVTATPMPAAPTPTEVGTNCEPVAENLKAPVTHAGDVFISNVEAAGLEYVEIRNLGAATANLGGWTLRDKNEVRQHYIFDEGAVLPGNMSLRVYTEPGHPYTFNSRRAIWNNCGDALELLDAAAHVVSTYGYGTHCAANCE